MDDGPAGVCGRGCAPVPKPRKLCPFRHSRLGLHICPLAQVAKRELLCYQITANLVRMASGNFSNSKSISGGVYECRIDFGPGYRVYFGKDGKKIIILLGGGTKKKQQVDIQKAHELWKEYKKRKKQG